MNTHVRFRTVCAGLLALVALSIATTTFAAYEPYLTIKGAHGKTVKTKIQPDGTFDSPALPPGEYVCSFTWDLAKGKAARSASKPSPASVSLTYEVKAPRDQSSGMATGKRMHKPFVITKELGREAATPSVSEFTFQKITIGEACDGIKGTIEVKSTTGGVMAMDDWSVSK